MAASPVRCCIVGGGPAGMLGLLLARAGVAVAVLEKHAAFLRDFRGDTIHPSTMVLRSAAEPALPLPLRLLRCGPALRRIPGRLVGRGVRPGHVRTPVARW